MASGTKRAQELLGNTKCDICDTYKDVLWRCLNCQQTLCNQCKKYHLRTAATKNHTVTELAITANGKDESTSIFCPDHENEVFQKYCTTCNSLVCIDCITGTHKDHEYEQIGHIAEQIKTQLEEVFEQMKTITIPKFEQSIISITEKQKNYSQETEKLATEITTKGENLKQAINEITHKLKNQLMQQATKDEQCLKETKEHIDKFLTTIKMQLNKLEQQVHKFNDFDIISKAASIIDCLSQLTNDIDCLEIPTAHPPRLQTSQYNEEGLKKMIGLLVFEIIQTSAECPCEKERKDKILYQVDPDGRKEITIQDLSEYPTNSEREKQNQQQGHRDTDLKGKPNASESGKSKSHDTKNIEGNIVFSFKRQGCIKKIKTLNENEAWLLLHTQTESIFRLFSNTHTHLELVCDHGKCLTLIKSDLSIFDMDTTTSGDLLVTGDHRITKVSRSGKIETFADLSPFATYGIHVTQTGEVLVGLFYTFDGSRVSTRLSPLGQILMAIKNTNMSVDLGEPCRIIQNVNHDIVICNRSYIIVVDRNGTFRFKYTGPTQTEIKKFRPTDISCNQSGQILVADEENNTIHLLDKNGVFIQCLLTNTQAFKGPQAIATDITGKLWVGDKNGQVFVFNYLCKYIP